MLSKRPIRGNDKGERSHPGFATGPGFSMVRLKNLGSPARNCRVAAEPTARSTCATRKMSRSKMTGSLSRVQSRLNPGESRSCTDFHSESSSVAIRRKPGQCNTFVTHSPGCLNLEIHGPFPRASIGGAES